MNDKKLEPPRNDTPPPKEPGAVRVEHVATSELERKRQLSTSSSGRAVLAAALAAGRAPSPSELADLLACPYCRHPVQSDRPAVARNVVELAKPEPVVCFHCTGIAIDHAGRLRQIKPGELAVIDWTEYQKCVRELAQRHGPAPLPCPHPTRT